jgi:hypothetical protein
MKDEILVEPKNLKNRRNPLYVITSTHAESINLLTRKKSLDEVDLDSLKGLGFAVAHNKLDKDGTKVYLKHNTRTFAEKMNSRKQQNK